MNLDFQQLRDQYIRQVLESIEASADGGMPFDRAIAKVIEIAVNDPCLAPSVTRKVVRAVGDDDDRLHELAVLLAVVMLKRAAPDPQDRIKRPAGYFGSSVRRMLAKWGVAWDQHPTTRTER